MSGFPSQIKYIVGNEACERFSYYGMRSILVIFMTTHLLFKPEDGKAIYHLFVSAAYLLPLLGGFIADRYWGKYKTILYISLIYCLGHLTLSLFDTRGGLYLGLALIAIGTGAIKPCVAAYVGDQFNESNKHLMKRVFDLFYWSINFGATFSTLLIPKTLTLYGPSVAFGIPGILMAIATVIFWLGRHQYVQVPPTGKGGATGFMPILLYSIRHYSDKKTGQDFFDVALAKFRRDDVEAAKAAASVFKVFITVSAFWALFDQQGSSWVLQAEKMDPHVLGMTLEASQIQALNPLMVMVLIPLFTFVIYPAVERLGITVTPLRKMTVGMFLAGFSFLFVAGLETLLNAGQVLSMGWQFIPYLIITCSEIMVSITGLEFAYTQAPKSMKSTIMSFWLLTVFAGNLLTAYVSEINVFKGPMFFYFFAALMFVVAAFFMWGAIRYKVREYIEPETAPA